MTEIEKLQEQINSLQKQIDLMKMKELEVKPLGFKDLKNEQIFYIIDLDNDIVSQIYENDMSDQKNIILGNAFRTEEEANTHKLQYLRKLEILEWLHRNRDFGENFYINLHRGNKEPVVNEDVYFINNQYPLSYQNANKAIELFGNDLKLIFDL